MIRNTPYYTAVEYLTRNHTYRALLPLLLFSTGDVAAAAAPVRHRAPDGKYVCWFNESESIKCFLSLPPKTIYFKSIYPRTVLSQLRLRFVCTVSSAITGMRVAKAGVSPPRRSPPCIYTNMRDI